MSIFTTIILVLFVGMLSYQFVGAIDRECYGLSVMFALEIIFFIYLIKTLV